MANDRLTGIATTGRMLWVTRNAGSLARAEFWKPSDCLYPEGQTFARDGEWSSVATLAITSQSLVVNGGAVVRQEVPVNGVAFWSGSTASITLTHSWACIIDQDLNVLAKTSDNTTAEWTSNTKRTFTFASPYVPVETEGVYLGLVVVAATMPTLRGFTSQASAPFSDTPVMRGTLPGPYNVPADLGATIATPNTVGISPYAYLT